MRLAMSYRDAILTVSLLVKFLGISCASHGNVFDKYEHKLTQIVGISTFRLAKLNSRDIK